MEIDLVRTVVFMTTFYLFYCGVLSLNSVEVDLGVDSEQDKLPCDISGDKSATCSNENRATFDFNRNDGAIFEFDKPSSKTDFVLLVEGKKLYVSKTILAFASPVFEHKFSKSGDTMLELPGKKVDDVQEFLRCIYPSFLLSITAHNAERILPLIHEFEVHHLKARCETVLVESVGNDTDASRLLELLSLAHLYSFDSLSEKCLELAALKPQNEIVNAERKHPVPAGAMVKLNERLLLLVHNTAETCAKYIASGRKLDVKDFVGRSVTLYLPNVADAVIEQNVTMEWNITLTVTAFFSTVHTHYWYIYPLALETLFIRINSLNGDHKIKTFARSVLVTETDDMFVDIDTLGIPIELANRQNLKGFGQSLTENDKWEIVTYILVFHI